MNRECFVDGLFQINPKICNELKKRRIFTKFVNNLYSYYKQINKIKQEEILQEFKKEKKIYDVISLFIWCDSNEGFHYWNTQYYKFKNE